MNAPEVNVAPEADDLDMVVESLVVAPEADDPDIVAESATLALDGRESDVGHMADDENMSD